MGVAEAEDKNYAVNRVGVAILLAIVAAGVLGCIIVAAILIAQYFQTGAELGFTTASVAVLFGCVALIVAATERLAKLMVWAGPLLTISDAGVLYRLASDQIAPWSAITEIKVSPKAAGPELVLEPQFAKQFRWKGAIAKTLKPRALVVATGVLKGPAGEIAYELQSRWQAVQTGRPRPVKPLAPEPFAAARRPYLTLALIILLAFVFVAEGWFGLGARGALTTNPDALAALGGVVAGAVWRGHEYWRLFTGPLMHANAGCLLVNGIVLYAAGSALERLVGRGWLALLFAAGALGGAAASAAMFYARVVNVGASGANLGLIGALFALAGRLEPQGRKKLRWRAAQLAILALLPLGPANDVFTIGYAAHCGGLVAGVLVAALLRSLWRRDEESPPYTKAAGAIGAAYFAVAAAAIVPIARAWAALAQG